MKDERLACGLNELWVSSSGNDSNPGTEAAPLLTIEGAFDSIANKIPCMRELITIIVKAGETVSFRSATGSGTIYTFGNIVTIKGSSYLRGEISLDSGSGNTVNAIFAGQCPLYFQNIRFDSINPNTMFFSDGRFIFDECVFQGEAAYQFQNGNYTFSGSALLFATDDDGGFFRFVDSIIKFNGNTYFDTRPNADCIQFENTQVSFMAHLSIWGYTARSVSSFREGALAFFNSKCSFKDVSLYREGPITFENTDASFKELSCNNDVTLALSNAGGGSIYVDNATGGKVTTVAQLYDTANLYWSKNSTITYTNLYTMDPEQEARFFDSVTPGVPRINKREVL